MVPDAAEDEVMLEVADYEVVVPVLDPDVLDVVAVVVRVVAEVDVVPVVSSVLPEVPVAWYQWSQ